MTLHTLTASLIDQVASGAAVLGTGGGGDPHVGSLIAKRMILEHGEVEVMQASQLGNDDFVVPLGMIGAPSVSVERIMAESEFRSAISAIERETGKKATAIMPIEVGGGNSMLPIAAAALMRLPIVDADAMGRAFPEAQMVSFHLHGYGPGTTVLVDHHGNEVAGYPINGVWSERISRAIAIEMGGGATMIDYAYSGEIVRKCAIPGTLTLARELGAVLAGLGADGERIRDEQKVSKLCEIMDGHLLFHGKIQELQRDVVGGFTRGEAELTGVSAFLGQSLRLKFQNEMLIAHRNGELIAVTPDLICVLDLATGNPVTTESLRYGSRIAVLGAPCHPMWRSQRGLETAGPRHFGYEAKWQPVEQLVARDGKV